MTTREPNERLPTHREGGEAGPTTVAENVDSPNDTASIDSLDPAGQDLFEKIGVALGLPIPVRERLIDRFEVRGVLGRGGMGVVYRAFDPDLDREVALKLINARSLAKLEILRARLVQEAKVLAQLEHSNVVRVYQVGEHEGEFFMALELVRGPDLRDWQRETSPGLEAVLEKFIGAGHGLAAAHEQGIVHRDFKPDNVMIARDGRAMVGDFGLAGSIANLPDAGEEPDSTTQRLTGAGEVIGTFGYMSPEQLRGDEIDARTDQYAFCVSLWELLTGDLPFPAKTRADLLRAMNDDAPSGGEHLPRWLRAVLCRGLAADPSRRFPDLLALIERLERGLARKRRWLIGGGFGLAAAVTVTSVTVAALREPEMDCPLERELAELRESKDWQALTDELSEAGHDNVLNRVESKLAHRVAVLCPSQRDAAKQQLQLWLDALRHIAASVDRRTPEQLLADIEAVRKASFDRPPPVLIPEDVATRLTESEQLEREDRLPEAFEQAEKALELAEKIESPVGRALAHLRRGRLHALSDRGELALADYEQAHLAAYEAQYPDANLRAELLTARTEIMRLDRFDSGEASLQRARAQLIGLHERFDSPRWTEYHYLDAYLNKQRGDLDEALSRQIRVLIRALADLDRRQLALALINLGTIHETAEKSDLAEACYRLALKLIPEPSPTRHQAEYVLARLLVFDPAEELPNEQIAEARHLLDAIIAADADHRIPAIYTQLALAYRLVDTSEAGRIADDLTEQLLLDRSTAPRFRFEAWQLIALSKAERGLDYEFAHAEINALARELPDGEALLPYFWDEMVDVLGAERGRIFVDQLRVRLTTLPESERIFFQSKLDRLTPLDHSTIE